MAPSSDQQVKVFLSNAPVSGHFVAPVWFRNTGMARRRNTLIVAASSLA
jgi:hypothetical protein